MVPTPHQHLFPLWLEQLAVHQDYAWFLVVVAWGGVLLLWWRQPDSARGHWTWLPVAAWAGILSTAVQFMIFDPTFDWFQDRLVPGTTNVYEPAVISVELFGDLLQTLIWAMVAAVWWWQGASRRGARGWRWVGLPVAAAAGAVEFGHPAMGTWLLTLALAGGAAWVAAGLTAWRGWLGATLLAASWSTVGPWAWLGGGLQRNEAATPFGLIAALAQVAVATGVGVVLGRAVWAATEEEERAASRREMRMFCVLAAVWTMAGLTVAQRVGADNRRELQRNRLRTVAAEAMVFDRELLRPLAGDDLRLEWRAGTAGGVEPVGARSVTVAGPAGQALRLKLAEIMTQTPFLDRARILVLRDGWLLELARDQRPREPGELEVIRAATAEDVARWTQPEPYIEGAAVPEIDRAYFCRAPIVDHDGTMLGWLDYQRREFFQSLERKWRGGPLLVVALGLLAGGLVVLQRRSLRDRERAWRRAALETEANRLKTAFLARVSHELRTPLQSLLGYSELLERDAGDATARQRLARLREHGDLLLRLVNDLLDLSAIEAGGLRLVTGPVELGRLVTSTVDDLAGVAAAKGLLLRGEVGPVWTDRWFEADGARLRQILFNLVGNAVKFTDRGEVVVRLRSGMDDTVGGAGNGAAERVVLEVADTGPGISAAEQATLFGAFTRLEKTAEREGAGLGLAMVAALARLMGGSVAVASDGRTGTTLTVQLDLRAIPAPAFRRGAEVIVPVALAGRHILVAEDNRLVRELFVTVLTEAGAKCVVAEDGEEALHRALAGGCDAMVLDLSLPKLDGIAVARRLRSPGVGRDALRIVGVSAHASQADAAQALAVGMNAFLSKPVGLSELVAALAGSNPVLKPGRDEEVAEKQQKVQARLAALLRDDAERQRSALAAAVAAADGVQLGRQAHYLANSAAAVGDSALLEASRALEAAARADPGAVAAAWRAVEAALAGWIESPAGDGSG